jgi:hypothetical protein
MLAVAGADWSAAATALLQVHFKRNWSTYQPRFMLTDALALLLLLLLLLQTSRT